MEKLALALGWMLRPPYRWMRFEIAFAPSEPLRVISYWMPMFDFLQKSFRLNYGAMIHCKEGDHRAAAVSAAIVKAIHYVKADQAIFMIQIICEYCGHEGWPL